MELKRKDVISVIVIVGTGLAAFLIVFSLGVLIGIHRVESQKQARAVQVREVAVSQPPIVPTARIVSETFAALSVTPPALAGVQAKAPPAPVIGKNPARATATTLKRSEGIEHALIRQLRAKHKDKGLQWAQRRAHKLAVLAGLVGPGREIRIKNGINIKKGVEYVLNDDENQIITVFEGQEVRRTTIMKNLSHIQPVTPLPFEYVHHTPT